MKQETGMSIGGAVVALGIMIFIASIIYLTTADPVETINAYQILDALLIAVIVILIPVIVWLIKKQTPNINPQNLERNPIK